MKVIPAIDIKGEKVVRLIRGDLETETVYSDSPIKMAEHWASYGVEMIHVVDLEGAVEGRLKNFEIVRDIAKSVKCDVELGGGIRDEATIKKVLDAGIAKVVIGTKALDKKFIAEVSRKFKDRIVVGIDAKRGMVHSKGWLFNTNIKAINLAKIIEAAGIKTINYTDISKDGTLEGPNIQSLKELLKATGLEVIASGGIANIEDIKRLKLLEKDGLKGIIIGKALYENTIDLKEVIKVCSQKE